jgi:hypothetical protein
MTHLFLFFILSISIGLADCDENTSEEVIKSVKLQGFTCTQQKLTNCSYTECSGSLGNYPKPVLITIPETVKALKLHFHGHILGLSYTKPYEGNASSMIKAFGIQESLCQNSEVTIFPQSTGPNTSYKEFFKNNESYTKFFSDIHTTLGNNLKEAPLHLAGHSGGGKYVAGALNAGINPSKVSIFDGIYSTTTKDSLKDWYNKGEGKLTLATVKGMDPEKFSNELRKEVGTTFTSTKSTIKNTVYDVHKSDRFTHYSRGYNQTAHFNVVTEIWPGTN